MSTTRSLRIPSAFCGLYTLRPSYERLPYYGAVNALEGQESISSVIGPMANSMSGVKIFTKAIIDSKPWTKDPLVLRKEWSEKEYRLSDHGGGKSLCFGCYGTMVLCAHIRHCSGRWKLRKQHWRRRATKVYLGAGHHHFSQR